MNEKIIFEKIIEKIKHSEYYDKSLLKLKTREDIINKLIELLIILEMDHEALETYMILNDYPDVAFKLLKNEPKYNSFRNFVLEIVNVNYPT